MIREALRFVGFFLCLFGGVFSFVAAFQYLLITPVSPLIEECFGGSFGGVIIGGLILRFCPYGGSHVEHP